ncbi:DNA internalization-related competence protein ComEC/Rec2 [candidate division KSB1 bacterium]|nr:DNA internalization-related competence protein ComEC/Rec2 [candidate division KSB1 bacterium]
MIDPSDLTVSSKYSPFSLPAVRLALLVIAGILWAHYFPIPILTIMLYTWLLLFVGIILLFFGTRFRIVRDIAFALAVFGAVILRYNCVAEIFPDNHVIHFAGKYSTKVALCGNVAQLPVEKKDKLQFKLALTAISVDSAYIPVQGNVLVNWYEPAFPISYGDTLFAFGRLRVPPGERNPGEFNYQKYLYAQGIYGIVGAADSSHVQLINQLTGKWHPGLWVANAQLWCHNTINHLFSGQERALLKGLILGDRSEIDSELRMAFSSIGVMHVLAVSGLHVGFIILIIQGLFFILWIPNRWSWTLTMILLFLYAALVGFKPPVVRATVLAELYFLGKLLQRRMVTLNLLSATAAIMLLIRPLDLFETSFQLSFVAVLSIFYLYKQFHVWVLRISWIRHANDYWLPNVLIQLLLVSAAASVGTLPLIMHYFEKLPLLTIIVNLPIIPLVYLIIIGGVTTLVTAGLSMSIAVKIAPVVKWLIALLINFVTKTNQFELASINVYGVRDWHIFIMFIGIMLLYNYRRMWSRRLLIYGALIIANLWIWQKALPDPQLLKVAFLDVGQGDAALLTFPNGKHMLIDAGKQKDNFNAGERHVLPYIRRQGIDTLHAVVVSHVDDDHLGGIPYILDNVPVLNVYDNGDSVNSSAYHAYREVLRRKSIHRQTVHSGMKIDGFGECGVFVLNPDSGSYFANHNDPSVVLKIIYNENSFLFSGDIEKPTELMLARYDSLLQSTVLKVAHHGSKTSSTRPLLELIQPEFAVISVGETNNFGHPSSQVLARLDSLMIATNRTDLERCIMYQSNGTDIQRLTW